MCFRAKRLGYISRAPFGSKALLHAEQQILDDLAFDKDRAREGGKPSLIHYVIHASVLHSLRKCVSHEVHNLLSTASPKANPTLPQTSKATAPSNDIEATGNLAVSVEDPGKLV